LSDAGLEHADDELTKDHDEQEELEKHVVKKENTFSNIGKNAHIVEGSSPLKKCKKRKRPVVEKVSE
jgi:hypothetical protein